MPVNERESDSLEAHVAACGERYETLFNSLHLLDKRLDRFEGWGRNIAIAVIVKLVGVIGFLAAILWQMPAANAQMPCGDRAEVIRALEDGHGERKTATALSGDGGLIELYTDGDGRWTLLYILPDGVACLLAAGEAWETWRPAPAEPRTRTH